METTKIIGLILLLTFGHQGLLGDEPKILPKYIPTANRAPDLDFMHDQDDSVPLDPQTPSQNIGHQWVYWSLGFTFAAGGMTYLIWDRGRPEKVNKSVQVFTDSPN